MDINFQGANRGQILDVHKVEGHIQLLQLFTFFQAFYLEDIVQRYVEVFQLF